VLRARKVRKGPLDRPASPDSSDLRGLPVRQDHADPPAIVASQVPQGPRESRVPQDRRESKAWQD
jgi:hypothetical protein